MHALSLAAILAFGLAPALAAAAPTATCHCFRDRTFDPANPVAADPYALANARSSLLSAAFGVPKATLVQAVMTGTAPEDLWIAHLAGARTGRDAARLLDEAASAGSWRPVLAGAKGLPARFEGALARGAPASELAAIAVDEVVVARLGVEPAAVHALRTGGATSEQLVLSLLLAPRLKVPAPEVLSRYRTGRASWGALLAEAGLAPRQIEEAVRAALR